MKTENYQKIEITQSSNGYPKHIKPAYIGFNSYEEAEEFQNQFENSEICLFHKKDGWHFWENTGKMHRPLTYKNYLSDLGDNYNIYNEDQELERLKEMLSYCDDTNQMQTLIDNYNELLKKIKYDSDKDNIIILYENRFYDEVPENMMGYYHDTHSYSIGVLLNEETEED